MWWFVPIVVACTNSGLGRDDLPTGTEDTDDPLVVACPWEGTWDLLDVQCGSFPFDDWFAIYSSARLEITASAEGGCEVLRELRTDGCRETERMRWSADPEEPTLAAVASDGVTGCAPGGCAFPTVGLCALGDRADTEDTLVVELGGESDELTVTDDQPAGTFVDGAPACKLDVVTIWTRY